MPVARYRHVETDCAKPLLSLVLKPSSFCLQNFRSSSEYLRLAYAYAASTNCAKTLPSRLDAFSCTGDGISPHDAL
jgi:hypothetical protein